MDNWSRLEEIIKWAGLSTHSFAMRIGLNRSENLYQIKRGRNGISSELADRIIKFFPEIDRRWILSGEGYMFNAEPVCYEEAKEGIPFYSGDMEEIITGFREMTPQSYIKLPIICDCDLGLTMSGDSMTPDIDPGAIIILKQVDTQYISYGERYLVVTDRNILLREIHPVEETGKLMLVPANRVKYDSQAISAKSIKHLFLLRGIITVKA